jgi:hypothetical protein
VDSKAILQDLSTAEPRYAFKAWVYVAREALFSWGRNNLKNMKRSSIDSDKIKKTMRVLLYDEAKAGVSRVISQGFGESEVQLTDWDLWFVEYVEKHRDSRLLFCWFAKGGAALLCPTDHTGIWAMQREGLRAKGKVGGSAQAILEGLAKETGFII